MWWFIEWLSYGILYVAVGPVALCMLIGTLKEWWDGSFIRRSWEQYKERTAGTKSGTETEKEKVTESKYTNWFPSRKGLSTGVDSNFSQSRGETVSRKPQDEVSLKRHSMSNFSNVQHSSHSSDSNEKDWSSDKHQLAASDSPSSRGSWVSSTEEIPRQDAPSDADDIEVKDSEGSNWSESNSSQYNVKDSFDTRKSARMSLKRSSSGSGKLEQQRIESTADSAQAFDIPVMRRGLTAYASVGGAYSGQKNVHGNSVAGNEDPARGQNGTSVMKNVKSLWGEIAPHMSSSQVNLASLEEEGVRDECDSISGSDKATNDGMLDRRCSVDSVDSTYSAPAPHAQPVCGLPFAPATTIWLTSLLALMVVVMLTVSASATHCLSNLLVKGDSHQTSNETLTPYQVCTLNIKTVNTTLLSEEFKSESKFGVCKVLGESIPYFVETALVVDASKCILVSLSQPLAKIGRICQQSLVHWSQQSRLFFQQHVGLFANLAGEEGNTLSQKNEQPGSTEDRVPITSRWEFYALITTVIAYIVSSMVSLNNCEHSRFPSWLWSPKREYETREAVTLSHDSLKSADEGDEGPDEDWGCHVELEEEANIAPNSGSKEEVVDQTIIEGLDHLSTSETRMLHKRNRSSSVDTGLSVLAGGGDDSEAPLRFSLKSAASRVVKQLHVTKEFRKLIANNSKRAKSTERPGSAKAGQDRNEQLAMQEHESPSEKESQDKECPSEVPSTPVGSSGGQNRDGSLDSGVTSRETQESCSVEPGAQIGGVKPFQDDVQGVQGDDIMRQSEQYHGLASTTPITRLNQDATWQPAHNSTLGNKPRSSPDRRSNSTPTNPVAVTGNKFSRRGKAGSEDGYVHSARYPRMPNQSTGTFVQFASPGWSPPCNMLVPGSPSSNSLDSRYSTASSFFDIDFQAKRKVAEERRLSELGSKYEQLAESVCGDVESSEVAQELENYLETVRKQVAKKRHNRMQKLALSKE